MLIDGGVSVPEITGGVGALSPEDILGLEQIWKANDKEGKWA